MRPQHTAPVLTLSLGLLLAPFLGGCINEVETFHRVVVSGEVIGGSEQGGAIYGEALHAWAGEGALAHPLKPFAFFELPGEGPFEFTIDYPVGEGEGLAIYGYQDINGDGLLCTPSYRDETAGITVDEGFNPIEGGDVPFTLTLDLNLDTPCAGPEALYP